MLEGYYFDGKTARRQAARIDFCGDNICVNFEGGWREENLKGVVISERLAQAPRTLTFNDGAYCEVAQTRDLDAALTGIGHTGGTVEHWQWSMRAVLLCLVLLLAMAFAGYKFGLPALAEYAATRIPQSAVEQLSHRALEQADNGLLTPSGLLVRRRDALRARFLALRPSTGSDAASTLQFRTSPSIGPNAFSLPDGTIVVTDELVRLADNDDQLIAVLGHELGHVHYRHSLRILLHSTVIGALMTAWVGDASAAAAFLPAAALQTRFSREFELQADAYSATLLRAHGLSPKLLEQMLDNLEMSRRGEHAEKLEADAVGDFFASHPSSKERIEALRRLE